MGRRISKRGVAGAGLFGAYQRRGDLQDRNDIESTKLTDHQAENADEIARLEAKLVGLGGDPVEVLTAVQRRELELRAAYNSTTQSASSESIDAQRQELVERTVGRPT